MGARASPTNRGLLWGHRYLHLQLLPVHTNTRERLDTADQGADLLGRRKAALGDSCSPGRQVTLTPNTHSGVRVYKACRYGLINFTLTMPPGNRLTDVETGSGLKELFQGLSSLP